MTRLQDADAVFFGAAESEAVKLGASGVWVKPPPAPTTGWFGTKSYNDNPNNTADGRLMIDRFAMTEAGTLTGIFVRSGTTSEAGTSIKGVVYADNGSGAPGALLGVGAAVAVPVGAAWFSSAISLSLSAGNYWIGAVSNSYQGSLDYSASHTAPNSLLWASSFSYTSPPDPAPGSPTASYPLDLSVYAEYTIP